MQKKPQTRMLFSFRNARIKTLRSQHDEKGSSLLFFSDKHRSDFQTAIYPHQKVCTQIQ